MEHSAYYTLLVRNQKEVLIPASTHSVHPDRDMINLFRKQNEENPFRNSTYQKEHSY